MPTTLEFEKGEGLLSNIAEQPVDNLGNRAFLLARKELGAIAGEWGGEGVGWDPGRAFLRGLSGEFLDLEQELRLSRSNYLDEVYSPEVISYLLGRKLAKYLTSDSMSITTVGTEGMPVDEEGNIVINTYGKDDEENYSRMFETTRTEYMSAMRGLQDTLISSARENNLDFAVLYPKIREASQAVSKIVSARTKLTSESGRGITHFTQGELWRFPVKSITMFGAGAAAASILAACTTPTPPAIVEQAPDPTPTLGQVGVTTIPGSTNTAENSTSAPELSPTPKPTEVIPGFYPGKIEALNSQGKDILTKAGGGSVDTNSLKEKGYVPVAERNVVIAKHFEGNGDPFFLIPRLDEMSYRDESGVVGEAKYEESSSTELVHVYKNGGGVIYRQLGAVPDFGDGTVPIVVVDNKTFELSVKYINENGEIVRAASILFTKDEKLNVQIVEEEILVSRNGEEIILDPNTNTWEEIPPYEVVEIPGTREEIREEVQGVPVNIDIILDESINNPKLDRPIRDVNLNTSVFPDAADRIAQAVAVALYNTWKDDVAGREAISFESYMSMVKEYLEGERPKSDVLLNLYANDLATKDYDPELRGFDPAKLFGSDGKVTIVWKDRNSTKNMVNYTGIGNGYGTQYNEEGQLEIWIDYPEANLKPGVLGIGVPRDNYRLTLEFMRALRRLSWNKLEYHQSVNPSLPQDSFNKSGDQLYDLLLKGDRKKVQPKGVLTLKPHD